MIDHLFRKRLFYYIYLFLVDMRKQEIEINLLYHELLFTFHLPSGATVGDLKDQIFRELQILPKNQDLEFNDSIIKGDQLKLTGISAKMPILINISNMEDRTFQFNNLKGKQKIPTFRTNNLRHPRLVYPGFILMAKCKKQGCDAYKKEVNINKGFGKFDLGRMLNNSLCPLCSEKTERVYNFGYHKTNIAIEGGSEKNGQYKISETVDDELFHTFKEDNGVQKWDYLEIITSPLKKK